VTTQPEPDRLHHLLDRLRRGALLEAEGEQLVTAVTKLADRAEGAEAARDRLLRSCDRRAARIRDLEQRVAELTAGQCTHALAVCEKHHRVPVTGCPYPRCKAAAARTTA